jgi:HTH-type transcriptional regulator/antitoxin HigA
METLTYKLIKTDAQYRKYCNRLEALLEDGSKARGIQDEMELLTLLIEHYEKEHNRFDELDPIALLKALMKEHKMKSVDLSRVLGVSEGLVSDMLHYRKGFSKESVRILSTHFKVAQEAFNRPYSLKATPTIKSPVKEAVKSTRKRALA